MIKRIITFAVCLAVCISSVVIGMTNLQAKEGTVAENAGLGAIGSGSAEGINLTQDILEETDDGYKLKDNVNITSTKDAAWTELQKLNRTSGDTIVFDGNNCTITTSVPLFDNIANCTIKDLTVNATIAATDDDIVEVNSVYSLAIFAKLAYGTVNFNNVTIDGSLTFVNGEKAGVSVTGFIGQVNPVATSVITFTDCENSADITVNTAGSTKTAQNHNNVAGFVGRAINNSVMNFVGCVNTGTITVTNTSSGAGANYVGGFTAWTYNGKPGFTNCANFGNITVDTAYYTRVGGFAGYGNNYSAGIVDCVNYGDINVTDTGSDEVWASGIVTTYGSSAANATANPFLLRCVNVGTITCTSEKNVVSGLALRTKVASTFTDCVNIGTVSGVKASGLEGTGGGIIYNNCYTTAITNDTNSTRFNGGGNNDVYLIAAPDASFITNAKNNKVNNASALIAVILATTAYAGEYSNDDGMFLSTFEGFTVAAGEENGKFTTTVDQKFYDAVAAIAGNVEFGAIITLSAYLDNTRTNYISEFTHDAFKAYLDGRHENNELMNIEALYMETGTTTLGKGDVDGTGKNYNANITLKDANAEYDYTARAFIKIGDAYIYSK